MDDYLDPDKWAGPHWAVGPRGLRAWLYTTIHPAVISLGIVPLVGRGESRQTAATGGHGHGRGEALGVPTQDCPPTQSAPAFPRPPARRPPGFGPVVSPSTRGTS